MTLKGKHLTPYGGLLPVATKLEKLGFRQLVESTITSKRVTRVMCLYKFALGLVLGFYVGFQRLNQMRFIAHDPMLTGYWVSMNCRRNRHFGVFWRVCT